MEKVKLDLPKAEFHKTSIRGVKYLMTTRSGKEERVYYIRYRDATGKQRFEPAGKTATTEFKANTIRLDRSRGKELPNRVRKQAKEAAKIAAEGRMTFDRLWKAWQEAHRETSRGGGGPEGYAAAPRRSRTERCKAAGHRPAPTLPRQGSRQVDHDQRPQPYPPA